MNNILDITIHTKHLTQALNFAHSIVEKNQTSLQLNNVQFTVKDNVLELCVTNGDLYLTQNINVKIIQSGSVTIATQTILDVMRKITEDTIQIKQFTDTNKIEIIGTNYKFDLLTIPEIKFLSMESLQEDPVIELPCKELVRIIESTNFAISTDETRYNLNGLYLHTLDNKFVGATTDGHRLSVASFVMHDHNIKEFGVIVPRKTIYELLKILKDQHNIQSQIYICISHNKIKFTCNNVILISKLIDGKFPEYSAFIPQENPYILTIHSKLFADAIDRVSSVTVDTFRAIKLFIKKEHIQITASGEAKGSAVEKIQYSDTEAEYCNFVGEELSIGFNPKYIYDVLHILNGQKAILHFKDEVSPILIDAIDCNEVFVIMPLKL